VIICYNVICIISVIYFSDPRQRLENNIIINRRRTLYVLVFSPRDDGNIIQFILSQYHNNISNHKLPPRGTYLDKRIASAKRLPLDTVQNIKKLLSYISVCNVTKIYIYIYIFICKSVSITFSTTTIFYYYL
jgi:hypothetical protein